MTNAHIHTRPMSAANAGSRDMTPRVRSQARILIDAPASRIWSLVTDIERWPRWNPAVKDAHLTGGVAPGGVFVWTSGGFRITSTFRTVEPPARLAWTGSAFGVKAIHEWRFEAVERGVAVTTTEGFGGWLSSLMPGAMQKMLDETLEALLASLKAAAEAADA